MTALPEPTAARWQPLRLGLVELYHYDAEEFWFADGHLLLRGNNGTGKSKVLSLTLPFLLDASLASSRLEPDADPGKRMDWNLLLGGKYDRRTGYAWIEFGRINDDGVAEYTTLGAGLRATAGRASVDSWFFVTDQRVGVELALVSAEQTVATRERLIEAVGSHRVFATARDYRRAVDERLFGLGPERYRALIDTLIQLRQPQLSKQPNENNLSAALSQAFPPLERNLLEDVAEAMTQLDEYADELADYRAMRGAVAQFNIAYGRYARISARRRAREVRQAQTAFDNASAAAREARDSRANAQAERDSAAAEMAHGQARDSEIAGQLEVLKNSPEMRSANELHRAQTEAEARDKDADRVAADHEATARRHADDQRARKRRDEAADASRNTLHAAIVAVDTAADGAGLAKAHQASWRHDGSSDDDMADTLAQCSSAARQEMPRAQNRLAAQREQQIAQIRRQLAAVEGAENSHRQAQTERDARLADSEITEEALVDAREALSQAGDAYIADWQAFIDTAAPTLGRDWPVPADALADWVTSLDGESPLAETAQARADAVRERLAERAARLDQQQAAIDDARRPLHEEQARLSAGGQPSPPVPATRDAERKERPGAPLWQLVDFKPELDPAARAGIEAALEAAGVLDAWVCPSGDLLERDTHDAWLVERDVQPRSLARALDVVIDPEDSAASQVTTGAVQSILQSIAWTDDDNETQAEFWLASNGRYRLGPVTGAWAKPAAEYIGATAREAARRRRLAAIEAELTALAAREQDIKTARDAVGEDRQALNALLAQRPRADGLQTRHAEAAAAEKAARQSRQALAEAEQRLHKARSALEAARRALAEDADDVGLPGEREALDAVAEQVSVYRRAVREAEVALRDHAKALQELADQQQREQASRGDSERLGARAQSARQQADTAAARHQALAQTVGAGAEEVLQRLNALERERSQLGDSLQTAREHQIKAIQRLGGAEQAVADTQRQLAERHDARARLVDAFQAFGATGLLEAALPAAVVEVHLPDRRHTWTIDPALSLARATETALADTPADDAAWQQAQNGIGREYAELQRALSAQGHHTSGEPSDHGFIVRVVFNQQNEAPHALERLLDAEIAERTTLLTAKESEVIENHLQAEVAAQLQGLMRDADTRVAAINEELGKRPTSTGVKFKLVWQPVEAEDASLANLADVRARLLNKISDAWSAEDRAAIGAFLQQRIQAERERDDGSARIDQLARALDYRAWHQFRVRRWQDGQWKPLSGPASSGERALGLTVPLFAAAASHYETASQRAPRLVLLDEAFAGIDDGARAHCMGLIREFDLDFVMTSEREWACYAALPGVSICQLVRRGDIDAVFVSRWYWNGKARERGREPAHSAAASAPALEPAGHDDA